MSTPSAAAPIAMTAATAAPPAITDAVVEHGSPPMAYRSPAPAPEPPRYEPKHEPRYEPSAVPPPPSPPPQQDLDTVLRDSGLIMIETDRGKAQESEPGGEPQAPRPRRERRAPPPGVNEPLEQVETRGGDAPGEPRLP